MTTRTVRPISTVRVVVIVAAIVLAAGLAVTGTTLGARLHSEPRFSGEGGQPVYPEYGWPWGWKTNAPGWLIEFWNDNGSFEGWASAAV